MRVLHISSSIHPVMNSMHTFLHFRFVLQTPRCSDPKLRTANTAAECGSKDDIYYFSPWRAPGSAPVIDACGVAGGRLPGQGNGCCGAEFVNTSVARLSDHGSALPKRPTGTVWKAGTNVRVCLCVCVCVCVCLQVYMRVSRVKSPLHHRTISYFCCLFWLSLPPRLSFSPIAYSNSG